MPDRNPSQPRPSANLGSGPHRDGHGPHRCLNSLRRSWAGHFDARTPCSFASHSVLVERLDTTRGASRVP
ncbi:hypothetical protein CJ030_MR1G028630 [Morella rubra]|uniref:Uncharacterized protein n=1 Tax=Morella rubra TaxID=262757 RepID=A0A6A1WPP9_9ROSI|nr:hypothetical protein CJ030_MR1G028630 [Morella rubra]